MVDTATTRSRLRKQAQGTNLNIWGDPYLNTDLDLIDDALDGHSNITISAASTTLTSTNYAADQSRMRVLVLTGTLAATSTITIPSVEKYYLIVNNCTMAGFTLTIKTASGVGVSLPTGFRVVTCNATDCFARIQVDMGANEIVNAGTPTVSSSLATKGYVDTATAVRDMGGFRITTLGTGTATTDAVNLGQMTVAIAAGAIPAASGAIKVSLTDTTANYAGAKFSAGNGVAISTSNPAGNEILAFAVYNAGTATSGIASLASQAEATAGVENTKIMTSLRVVQSITANVATPAAAGGAFTIKTAGFTAAAGVRYLADCSNTAFTMTMPTTPANTDAPIHLIKEGSNTLTIDFGSNRVRLPGGSTTTGTVTIDGFDTRDYFFAYIGTNAAGTTIMWVF